MSSRMFNDLEATEQHEVVPLPLEFPEEVSQEEAITESYVFHAAENSATLRNSLPLFEACSEPCSRDMTMHRTARPKRAGKKPSQSRRRKKVVAAHAAQPVSAEISVRAELTCTDQTWVCEVPDAQSVSALDYMQGGLPGCVSKRGSWRSPERFSEYQRRVLASSTSWHPGIFRALATCSTSQVLCFETDAPYCALELYFDSLPKPTQAIYEDVWTTEARQSYDFDRISVSIDGTPVSCVYPSTMREDAYTGMAVLEMACDTALTESEASQQLHLWPDKSFTQTHTVRIYLPHTRKVWVRALYHTGTFIKVPDAERMRPQLLVLGDSIAQGYLAQEAAHIWPQRVAEELQYTLVNQGLGAQVFSPETIMGLSEYVHPRVIIVEFGANYRFEAYSASAAERDIRRYFTALRQSFPYADIYVVGLLGYLPTWYPVHPRACTDQIDALLHEAARVIDAQVIEGKRVLGGSEQQLSSWLVDASDHPNDEGHMHMAKVISAAIRRPSQQQKEPPATQPLPLDLNVENL